jgi:hypothetical protein
VIAAREHRLHLGRQPIEPGPAVSIGEWRSRGHLGDVRFGMKIVAVEKRPAEIGGKRLADLRLAATGHAHQHDDHGAFACACVG